MMDRGLQVTHEVLGDPDSNLGVGPLGSQSPPSARLHPPPAPVPRQHGRALGPGVAHGSVPMVCPPSDEDRLMACSSRWHRQLVTMGMEHSGP